MIDYVRKGRLEVAGDFAAFVDQEALPGTGIDPEAFWPGLERMVTTLGPELRALLARRDELAASIDAWRRQNSASAGDPAAYRTFLESIGYLAAKGPAFTLETTGVDDEVAAMAGPQVVAPADDGSALLAAANARWGSLYDALYDTDAVPEDAGAERRATYNPVRGAKVVAQVRDWLDAFLPIENLKGRRSHGEVLAYTIEVGTLLFDVGEKEPRAYLSDSAQFLGYQGDPLSPSAILLEHNGLGIELRFDRRQPFGKAHPAGLSDVHLEAAPTVMVDFEATESSIAAYRQWFGLMNGSLAAADDRIYRLPDAGEASVPGRSLLLVGIAGPDRTDPRVRDASGLPVPRLILDALVTGLIGLRDLKRAESARNSREQAIYIVVPRTEGPEEVAFADRLFARAEDVLGLPRNTLKLGIVDETCRTSASLEACISAARARLFHAGTSASAERANHRIAAREDNSVDVAIACGLPGRAQIGQGPWPVPDRMSVLLTEGVARPEAGATASRVTSPTAATLHAVHFHLVDVGARHAAIASRPRVPLEDLLPAPDA